MNSITIVFLCLVFLGKVKYFSNWNNSYNTNYLVVQQGIDAINCYICDPGTDGCGTSFKATGAGVVPTSDSSPVYCTVHILLIFVYISTSFLYRNGCTLPTPMPLNVTLAFQETVLRVVAQPVVLPSINIVVQRSCATELRWERRDLFLQWSQLSLVCYSSSNFTNDFYNDRWLFLFFFFI
jgi:hypothetical protein